MIKEYQALTPPFLPLSQPKLASHYGQCRAGGFTCIDCSRHFDRQSVQGHTSCVTEHEKYAQGATKPGGFASKGFFGEAPPQGGAAPGAPEGLEFLSTRAPWVCSICNVTCTSHETLVGHAQGAKHKRRSKAAIAARDGGAAAAEAAAAAETQGAEEAAPEPEPASNGKEEKAKEKKIKWKKVAAAELKKSGGSMKAKKFQAALAAAAAAGEADFDAEAVLKKLAKSKKFEFEGKTVHLRE